MHGLADCVRDASSVQVYLRILHGMSDDLKNGGLQRRVKVIVKGKLIYFLLHGFRALLFLSLDSFGLQIGLQLFGLERSKSLCHMQLL